MCTSGAIAPRSLQSTIFKRQHVAEGDERMVETEVGHMAIRIEGEGMHGKNGLPPPCRRAGIYPLKQSCGVGHQGAF